MYLCSRVLCIVGGRREGVAKIDFQLMYARDFSYNVVYVLLNWEPPVKKFMRRFLSKGIEILIGKSMKKAFSITENLRTPKILPFPASDIMDLN